ncbi:hypothetical protein QBZ16_003100 [Prototheca wickerhamii]|uniref:Germin-like protein n=1 Tax=Prototheca wickerhamii TaxID=3111 RepID=A0AAD9MI10_PROWI|nr:hypothetical protein QBZ16_003100 [Prototheca wickerhamii]
MASRKAILSLLLALALSVRGLESDDLSAQLEAIPDSDFVFTPTPSNVISAGGASQRRTSREWEALSGLGISQTSFTLQPCGLRAPHIHQMATGLLYAIDAKALVVGFVQENGTSVENTIASGASAVFPQGLVHYQFNNACEPATYTITYNNAEGGTVNIVPALMKLPKAVVMSALGVNETIYEAIVGEAPTTNFIQGPAECLQRCGGSSETSLASVAGRRLLEV